MTDRACGIIHDDYIVEKFFIEKKGKKVPIVELINVQVAKVLSSFIRFLTQRVMVVAVPIIALFETLHSTFKFASSGMDKRDLKVALKILTEIGRN